jgi:hypothetical protein
MLEMHQLALRLLRRRNTELTWRAILLQLADLDAVLINLLLDDLVELVLGDLWKERSIELWIGSPDLRPSDPDQNAAVVACPFPNRIQRCPLIAGDHDGQDQRHEVERRHNQKAMPIASKSGADRLDLRFQNGDTFFEAEFLGRRFRQ